jgi:hypothetical protein|tara:strand:- start:300 stop:545 length:246 start_codon:yes stop_codon:yes gene_type:complete
MPKQKRYRLHVEFSSEKDMEEWAAGTTKRPYKIGKSNGFDTASGVATVKRYNVVAFLDEDWPEEKDLHPIAQGLRICRDLS